MTYRRGASLTTATTLGYADSADIGPTAGNGFRTRWPDDLAALQELGITDVRITLDWARLQPRPNVVDSDWAELFEQFLEAADAIGVRAWACLHDGAIPRWLDNDGGLDDDEAFTTWWPRWVERAADRFGDLVGGWIPFACIPTDAPERPWIDTWGILGGGGQPVVASVELQTQSETLGRYAERADLLGAALSTDWTEDETVEPNLLERTAQRWSVELRDAADAADRPLVIAGFSAGHQDADTAGEVVAAWRSMLDEAVADGVPIELAFLEPGIAGPDSLPGLLDSDRRRTPSTTAFLAD